MGRECSMRHVAVAVCSLIVVALILLTTSLASATITQGDFSVFGFFETREAGRWGEGSTRGGSPTTFSAPPGTPGRVVTFFGHGATHTGGSFDFNHWDLVEMRQLADIRPDYHMVKN